jgi:hypothetical protein
VLFDIVEDILQPAETAAEMGVVLPVAQMKFGNVLNERSWLGGVKSFDSAENMSINFHLKHSN